MNGIERNIQRIKRFSLTCILNDNGHLRHFHNGYEYVEIGGIKWATCNVGAESPTDSGLYFQWGDTQGYTAEQVMNGEKYFSWRDYKYSRKCFKYNNTNKKTVLEPLDDAAAFNMGVGWRTPTKEEFKALVDSATSKWVTDYKGSGINGKLFTDKKDNTKTLFFPAAGFCYDSSVSSVGGEGYYWSSSLNTDDPQSAFNLYFISEDAYWDDYSNHCSGFAVRGVVG